MARPPNTKRYHDLADVELCARVDSMCVVHKLNGAEVACTQLVHENYVQIVEHPGGPTLRVFSFLNATRAMPQQLREKLAGYWAATLRRAPAPEVLADLAATLANVKPTETGKDPVGTLRRRYQEMQKRLNDPVLLAHYRFLLEAYLDRRLREDEFSLLRRGKRPEVFKRLRDSIESRHTEEMRERVADNGGDPDAHYAWEPILSPHPFTRLALRDEGIHITVPCAFDCLIEAIRLPMEADDNSPLAVSLAAEA